MPTIRKEFGAVAILDALGASTFGEPEIAGFLNSRQRVLTELTQWVEDPHGSVKIEPEELVIFTFNDTIVIVLRCGNRAIDLAMTTSFASPGGRPSSSTTGRLKLLHP